jgi:glutathione S-transferase
LPFDLNQFAHVQNWLDRLKDIKGWKHPYDLMPRQA